MAVARPLLGLISLVLIAGAVLLHLFVILAGAVSGSSPINSIYFLQADTSAIAGAPAVSRWTFWNANAVDGSGNTVVNGVSAAFPLDPPSNFGTSKGVPAGFQNTQYFYLMTRFMFAFSLIALFFAVCALFSGLLALCSRIGSYLSSVLAMVALTFETLTAVLMTTAYVKGRDLFNGNNMTATIGTYAFGFMWAAVACLFLAMVLFCVGGAASKSKDNYGGETTATTTRKSRFGRRNKSARSRGSFIDSESQRPVVNEV